MKEPSDPNEPDEESFMLMGDIGEITEPEPKPEPEPGPPSCTVTWTFRCNLAWESLQQPGFDPDVRHCGTCDKYVYRCRTPDELRAHQRQGHCVAFTSDVARDGS